MKWEDLSEHAHRAMKELGNFGPTINVDQKLVKGYMFDDECGHNVKTYFGSDDLRDMAAGMAEVADWLDKRAQEAQQEPK
jgi:hypothetical protein